jgi:hypothetical protein
MTRYVIYITLMFLLGEFGYGQEIRLEHKTRMQKFKTFRLDKPVMIRTFDGNKLKGPVSISGENELIIDGTNIPLQDIMMISGNVVRDSRDKAIGVGVTIGAGVVFPVAAYYILGGIAWGMPAGIFVGFTILVFDLMLAYTGTNLMGIYPRRFSTLNWDIHISPSGTGNIRPIPLPLPEG